MSPVCNTTAEFTISGKVMTNPVFPSCYLPLYISSRIRYRTIYSKVFVQKLRFGPTVITRTSWRLCIAPFFIESCGLCFVVYFSFERCWSRLVAVTIPFTPRMWQCCSSARETLCLLQSVPAFPSSDQVTQHISDIFKPSTCLSTCH